MTTIYLPPCICEVPDDIDDPGAHLPACPHFDPAWDAAPLPEGAQAIDTRMGCVERAVVRRRAAT